MPNIGPVELIVILLIVLVFVGPKKLPGLGRSLGTGMREFKDSVSGDSKKDDDGLTAELEQRRQQDLPTQPSQPSATAEPAPLRKDPADPQAQPRDGSE